LLLDGFLATGHADTWSPPSGCAGEALGLVTVLARWPPYSLRAVWPVDATQRKPLTWTAILAAMTGVPHDRPDQLQQVQTGLLDGEEIIAVYDAIGAGTGFLGLTNRRVIIQDKSFVGKKVAITSIPYSRITGVSVVSNKSWAGSFFSTGAIAVHVGPHTYQVEFRGEQKSHHVHNVILHFIS
jgi:hypothetical protein